MKSINYFSDLIPLNASRISFLLTGLPFFFKSSHTSDEIPSLKGFVNLDEGVIKFLTFISLDALKTYATSITRKLNNYLQLRQKPIIISSIVALSAAKLCIVASSSIRKAYFNAWDILVNPTNKKIEPSESLTSLMELQLQKASSISLKFLIPKLCKRTRLSCMWLNLRSMFMLKSSFKRIGYKYWFRSKRFRIRLIKDVNKKLNCFQYVQPFATPTSIILQRYRKYWNNKLNCGLIINIAKHTADLSAI